MWIDAISIVCVENNRLIFSSFAFADYIVHYFHLCVYIFVFFVVRGSIFFHSFLDLLFFSWYTIVYIFLFAIVVSPCVVLCLRVQCLTSLQRRKKSVIKKIIIRTASLKTMSNSIIFISLPWCFCGYFFFFIPSLCLLLHVIFSVGLAIWNRQLTFRVASRFMVFVIWFLQTRNFSFTLNNFKIHEKLLLLLPTTKNNNVFNRTKKRNIEKKKQRKPNRNK